MKMCKSLVTRSILLLFALFALSSGAFSQISVGISVSFGPPPIPVYEQPICPAVDYVWVPGYWAYDPDFGYYWVPGTWVEAPQVGFLWTPGYWGWSGAAFIFHEGYWGPHVGFYGGINYGFGYTGAGFFGGRWEGGHFAYNTYVNHVNTTIIHNTYNETVTNISVTRISYNGGNGGVSARPTSEELAYARQSHVPPVAAQVQHVQQARANPELRATVNQGKPSIAATARPGDFHTAVMPAREAGGEYKAPPARSAASTSGAKPTYTHASDLQAHQYTPPNTGNQKLDQRHQQQQQQLAARQNQEHQKLQQRQQKEDQQATAKNYNDTKKQQLEQRHSQQTQQLEQRHTAQAQRLEQRQAPHNPKP